MRTFQSFRRNYLAWAVCLSGVWAVAVHAQAIDQTAQSAVYVLRGSMRLQSDSSHHEMLRALRELEDPRLGPLFGQLAESSHPVLQIHGLLGLARCGGGKQLDLVRVAAIQDPAIQAETISLAMDEEVLTLKQAQQLVEWPQVDAGVKVLVATKLIKAGKFNQLDLLHTALKSDNLARRGLAAMQLVQLGETGRLQLLERLNESDDPKRDAVRQMLLETMVRYGFDRAAPWAVSVCKQRGVDWRLDLMALRAALKLNHPAAVGLWRQRFNGSSDTAGRLRLALLALDLANHLNPKFFNTLMNDDDPLIERIGRAGYAVAANDNVDMAVIRLIEMHHPMANRWVLSFARDHATLDQARVLLLGLIMSFEDVPLAQRERAVPEVVGAARVLCDRDPVGVSLLRPILADPDADPLLLRCILVGLIHSPVPDQPQAVEGIGPFASSDVSNLAVVWLAKCGQPLTDPQREQLKLLVRGGGGLGGPLRLQAAWAYLNLTEQTQPAMASALAQ